MKKFTAWLASAGIRSIGYIGAGLAAWLLFNSGFLLGVGVGLFVADNLVTLKELSKKIM